MPVLRIVHRYPVIHHSHVLAAHAMHVNGFQSSHTAVVLYLHARKETHRVGHTMPSQLLQLPAFKHLRRNNLIRH